MTGPPKLRRPARLLAALLLFSASLAGAAAVARPKAAIAGPKSASARPKPRSNPLGLQQMKPMPRYAQAVALLPDGRVLVAGGNNASSTPMTSVEILDATAGSEWSGAVYSASSMTFARSSATITVLPNGNVLVTGGYDGSNPRSDGEVYNPLTNAWTATGSMTGGARVNHTATLLDTGNVLVCGGQPTLATVTGTCDLYSPASNSFSAAAPMLQARAFHTATLLKDGTVWVAGGWNPAVTPVPYLVTTERYFPAINQWQSTQVLNIERAYHTATLTGDNKVLVAGGFNGVILQDPNGFPTSGVVTGSSELYDPIGGSVVPGPPMQAWVMMHSAVLRPEGTVSAYGGMGNIASTAYPSFAVTFDKAITPGASYVTGNGSGCSPISPTTSICSITGLHASAPFNFYLGSPVTGQIIDGDVVFENPFVSLTGVEVDFAPGLQATLNRKDVSCDPSGACGFISADLPFTNPGGTFTLAEGISAGNQSQQSFLTGGSLPSGETSNTAFTGGSFSVSDLKLDMPTFLAGQSVTNVTLTLTAATWTETSSYTVTLNGGTASPAGTFAVNALGVVDFPGVTFSSLSGTISPASGYTMPAHSLPIDPSNTNLSVTGIVVSVNYGANGIDLGGATLSFDPPAPPVAYGVIRSMVFGDDEFFVPNTNQWTFQPPGAIVGRPAAPVTGASDIVLPNGDEFVIAGSSWNGSAMVPMNLAPSINVRDIPIPWTVSATNAGTSADPLKHAFHTSNLLPDGTILVAGGTDGVLVSSSAEIFNPATGGFTPTSTSMQSPREHHSASLLPNGNVLLAGGFTTVFSTAGPTNSAEIYYPPSKAFVLTQQMISSHSQHVAISLPNGNVFVAGGYSAPGVVTANAEIYVSTANAWMPTAPMPTIAGVPYARAIAASVLLQDGTIMVCGGTNQTGLLGSVLIYNPATNAWTLNVESGPALQGHTATLLADGRVLVAGGDDGSADLKSSFIYDPTQIDGHRWSSTYPLNFQRVNHSATLLPNGSVLVSGGVDPLVITPTTTSNALKSIEFFHPELESWTTSQFSLGNRSFHTATLAPNGNVYFIGGANGSVGTGQAASLYTTYEQSYLTWQPDQYGKTTPSQRQSSIASTTPNSPFLPGSQFNATGLAFRGGTEASGGAAGPANTSFSGPRLFLQKAGGSSGGGSDANPGFIVDLTPQVYANPANQSSLDTSLTVPLPAINGLPYGWYMTWVGDNDIFSAQAPMVQVGPPKPTQAPTGNITGLPLGVSSITWSFNHTVPGVDGYNLYNSLTGVFAGAVVVPAGTTIGTPLTFLQNGLPANAHMQLLVAGYTLSGDGPTATSIPVSVNPIPTIGGVGCGANNSGDTSTSIQWNWNPFGAAASYYRVYNSSTGVLLSSPTIPSFYDVRLATNSVRSIYVGAVANGVVGPLSPPTTCYTLAAVPTPWLPPIVSTEPTSISVNWLPNGNPSSTTFNVSLQSYGSSKTVTTDSTIGLSAYFPGLTPSSYYSASVAAVNGSSATSASQSLGATYTLPAAPASLAVLRTTPLSITVDWSNNANSTMTAYQVTYSTDNFATSVSTAATFAAQLNLTTAVISGLTTSTTYSIRVQAENRLLQTSAFSTSVTTAPYNGGAPPGSLAGVLSANSTSEFGGDIDFGNGFSLVDLRAPTGAFPTDTTVTISSFSGSPCPSGLPWAVTIVDSPPLQPALPLYFSATVTAAQVGSTPTGEITLARFDPTSGTCVPLETAFNATTHSFTARLNHFSEYQLVQIAPVTTTDGARVYPNPYRAATDGYVTVDTVPPGSRVRIMTLRGEKVLDQNADGAGLLTWSATNGGSRNVASGLYLVIVESGGSKKILKLAVIR